jgi:hypothetical protein
MTNVQETRSDPFLRAAIVLGVFGVYFAYVFRLGAGTFWTNGAGDWVDPYFINALLEHWYRSVTTFADPASPPMYFPVGKTLGYSHGLILYAPIYTLFRAFLHPFQAYNVTLLVVIAAGTASLYLLLRRFFGLSFIEALLLTLFFVTSRHVINGGTGVWSQRASVFLIPIILCILYASVGAQGPSQLVLAAFAGLLATLLFTQDFYTAQFALLFVVLLVPAALVIESATPLSTRIARVWKADDRAATRSTLVITVLAIAWTCYALLYGGGTFHILGLRITSHDWWRPALVALASLAVFIRKRGGIPPAMRPSLPRWLLPFAVGAAAGCAVFGWIYIDAYRAGLAFPEEQLLGALLPRDPSQWTTLRDVLSALDAYTYNRTFALAFGLAVAARIPRFRVDKRGGRYLAWLAAVSVLVILIPLRFSEYSIWMAVFEPLPGFSVIRDPKRIIPLYELTATVVMGFVLSRLPPWSALRTIAAAAICVLLAVEPNTERFDFLRPIADFSRWVEAPIEVDPSCRSFYVKPASAAYGARSDNTWSLYGVDSLFVALSHSLPALNGYSAWYPRGWTLTDPGDPKYPGAVKEWIAAQRLSGVCELDIDARSITP